MTIEPIEVQLDETIQILIDYISATKDISNENNLAFFYEGKRLLYFNKSFRYYDIKDNDCIVVSLYEVKV